MRPIDLAMFLGAGAALGTLYFMLVYRTVRLHAIRATATHIVPLYLMRVALAVAVFWVIAQQGAMPLLLALLGFVIARMIVQCRLGSR